MKKLIFTVAVLGTLAACKKESATQEASLTAETPVVTDTTDADPVGTDDSTRAQSIDVNAANSAGMPATTTTDSAGANTTNNPNIKNP